MKTFKIFAALTFILSLTFNQVNAQVEKSVVIYSVDLHVDVPCLGEEERDLVGSGSVTIFNLGHDRYVNKWEGVVYDNKGTEYTFTNKERYDWFTFEDNSGAPLDGGNTLQLRCGHKLVAIIHANFNHIIEDGSVYLHSGNTWVVCK